MQIAADTVIFERGPISGIARAYRELFQRICSLDKDLKIHLWGSGPYAKPLPEHPNIIHHQLISRDIRPARLRRYIKPVIDNFLLAAGVNKSMIWHSVYFAMPPLRPHAIIANAYDALYYRYPDMYHQPGEAKFRQLQRKTLQAADIVICNSHVTARDSSEIWQIPMERIRIIERAPSDVFREIDSPYFRFTAPTTRPFLLYVGTRMKHKNFKGFIDAFATWKDCRNFDVVVVSSFPWTTEEQQQLVNYALTSQVHLLLKPSDNELAELYNRAQALVHPSLWEGFGIPLIEALACGCPIVASNIPSTHEVCGTLPYYFEPDSAESFHAAVSDAISDGRRSSRVQAGLEHVKRYNWDRIASQLLDIYRSV